MVELAFDAAVGSYVYPRLPRAAALALIHDRATAALDKLHASGDTDHPDAAPIATGTRVPTHVLLAVRDAVREVAASRGYPEPLRRNTEWTFDSAVGRALHRTMDIVPADAAAEGVWSFLTLVLAPEIGPWRFPGRAHDRLLGRPRNVLRRTWWRAHILGRDLDVAPDGLQPLGEDELVQIMERPTLGGQPRVARALRDAIVNGSSAVAVARSEFARDLTKRVLRLTPFVALDVLDDDALAAVIDRLVRESAAALGRAHRRGGMSVPQGGGA